MRIRFEERFWDIGSPRVWRQHDGWVIRLWRLRGPLKPFKREVVRVARITKRRP